MSKSAFSDGVKAMLPAMIAALPFGMLFGALAVENGMTTAEAVLMSATIFGGASQMVGIELFGQSIAPWMIVLSIFAVNFRHVLYSAASGAKFVGWSTLQKALGFFFLTDPQFAETEQRYESGKPVSFAWYMGGALLMYVAWVAEGWVGAEFGKLIEDPKALGIDFLLPIYFLALLISFRKRPLWLPVVAVSATAAIISYWTLGSPWHVSLGALAGLLVAAAAPLPPVEEES